MFFLKPTITNFLTSLMFKNPKGLRLIKESFWVIFSQVIGVVGMLLIIKILSIKLNPEQYGIYSLFLTVGALINSFFLGGISSGIPRFYPLNNEIFDKSNYIYAAYLLCLKAILFEFVFLVFISIFLLFLGNQDLLPLVWISVIFSSISSFNLIINDIYNISRNRSKITLILFVEYFLRIAFVLISMYLYGNNTIVVIGAFLIATIITLIINIFVLKFFFKKFKVSKIPENIEIREWQSKIFKYSIPLSFVGLLSWLQSYSDRWALDYFSTPSDVGLYTILFQLGFTSSNLIIGVIIAIISPFIYQKIGNLNNADKNKEVHLIVWGTVLICFLLLLLFFGISFFIHKYIFYILVSSIYYDVSYLLPWMILAGGVFSISQLLQTKLSAEFKSKSILYIKFFSAFILVLSNSIGAYFFGLNGVVIALTFASFINFGIISLYTYKVHSK